MLNELRLARPQSVNLEQATWTIAPEISKNGKPLVIPLAPAVMEWFRDLLALSPGGVWILPGRRPTIPISANALNVALDR